MISTLITTHRAMHCTQCVFFMRCQATTNSEGDFLDVHSECILHSVVVSLVFTTAADAVNAVAVMNSK